MKKNSIKNFSKFFFETQFLGKREFFRFEILGWFKTIWRTEIIHRQSFQGLKTPVFLLLFLVLKYLVYRGKQIFRWSIKYDSDLLILVWFKRERIDHPEDVFNKNDLSTLIFSQSKFRFWLVEKTMFLILIWVKLNGLFLKCFDLKLKIKLIILILLIYSDDTII